MGTTDLKHGRHITTYMKGALLYERNIAAARDLLKDVEFTTFVGRGLSGLLVAPYLAYALDKGLGAVRKSNEWSHSTLAYEGHAIAPGAGWVFVDDFISMGETLCATIRGVLDINPLAEFRGAFLYALDGGGIRFSSLDDLKLAGWLRA